MTKEGKHNRAANLLWRTAEEGFWISEGTRHIKPKVGGDFPEGFDVRAALEPHIGASPLLEIGCGTGRIASLFGSQEYIGVDVNPEALRIARENLPGYDFRIHDDGFAYPDAPTVLFYTVLLHVSDEVLPGLLAQACSGRRQVVIAELMDQRWRRPQRVPVFNRNPDDYKQILRGLGFSLVGETKHAYERYNTPKFKEFDSRLTILGFSR
jgi:SAM-dependent methyltransferase